MTSRQDLGSLDDLVLAQLECIWPVLELHKQTGVSAFRADAHHLPQCAGGRNGPVEQQHLGAPGVVRRPERIFGDIDSV
eukprot:CAMPEP_0168498270 /NCGR_PEP_ID=MMETSP0228-20121227/73189_1 /TAXON_ID=133427 /ORGANISM="Protoceratium reticulatum, Strain CCCM 535 (=CCMP 1889)" /LENGTH=78 /DNA_ID=CAMNT_0008515161 /DNA_START=25 /DNA_END=258 /DNA_ORIENTATION=+